jgi:hypothetical protein
MTCADDGFCHREIPSSPSELCSDPGMTIDAGGVADAAAADASPGADAGAAADAGPCNDDLDCGDGYICLDQQCVEGCGEPGTVCDIDQVCRDGFCVDP